MTPEQFYGSPEWKAVRDLCKKRAGGLCERCLADGIIKAAVVAHHKTPITKDNINNPSITLSLDNLQALCTDCHAKVHHPNPTKRRWTVDEYGRVYGLDEFRQEGNM